MGDEVLYLDPHTTQRSGAVDNKQDEEQYELDGTYHCKRASRIPILSMDPSVAVVSKKNNSAFQQHNRVNAKCVYSVFSAHQKKNSIIYAN